MKKRFYKSLAFVLVMTTLFSLAACGSREKEASVSTEEVANDYYIDLTDLGMKLTFYLRLDEEGNFLFSNTLAFEVNKSSGTFQKSGEEYIMVYDSVNGEAKTMSDGLTSSFVVKEDGSLDFSGCEKIYYGSASADSSSPDNPKAKLIAHIVTEEFAAPETKSDFNIGTYITEAVGEDGITYHHAVSFYEDKTYLHLIRYEQDGKMVLKSENGTYGVSTTQLALGEHGKERAEGEVLSDSALKLSLFAALNDTERTMLELKKAENVTELAVLKGIGTVTGGNETFEVIVKIYENGSYETEADGFVEKGVLAIDTAEGYLKQYPNHPDTGANGLLQVETVPSGSVSYNENGKLVLNDLRVRNSESLTRYKCNAEEKKNMESAQKFFDWAFKTRAKNVIQMYHEEPISHERMFLNFCSHEPSFVSYGPAGLNASVKGVGFLPKDEYLEETLEAYIKHIKTYDPEDKSYGKRGLELLIKYMYADEAHERMDFTKMGSLEMAKSHTWTNYQVNKEAALIFHQPPMISYKLKGKVEIYDETISGKREIYQQFINAQHDMYHTPDMSRWLSYPAYIFRIEEVYDNSATKNGFGKQLAYPVPKENGVDE